MVKRFVCAALTVVMAATLLTGCVKVVKIGEEGKLTGATTFDAASSIEEIWESEIVPNCEDQAVEIAEVLTAANGNLTGLADQCGGIKSSSATYYNYCVKAADATITAVDAEGVYGTVTLAIDGYDGDATIQCQIGSMYKNTSIRDCTLKFEDFKNQTEFGQIGSSIITKMNETVVEPVKADLQVGKKIDITGCFTADSANTMLITPVSITVK